VKIAHTPPRYAPHIGGVEAVDEIIAEYSLRHGDDVVVLAADEPPGAPTSVNGVPVHRLRWSRKLANTNLTWGLPRALWREPFDVVHTLLVAQHPRIAAKTHLVPNGVDLARFTPPADAEPRGADLLFVSVLDDFHDYKGLSVLLRALRDVPEVSLHVVGDGPKRGVWEEEARALGVGERVRWHGAVDDDTLRNLYRTCGVFTLPSQTAHHEGGSSLVALEAMASSLPVVLADGVGDLAAEAAQAGAGLHVPSGDDAALAGALRAFTQDPERRRSAGKLAREHVEAYHSWDAACARITALYVG
jgi:glycosyltransferase involved in cell wall biosynthesis